MNPQTAKELLILYRPETADAESMEFAEALTLARSDAELARWFENHCTVQKILRARFQELKAPAGLKEQILSEYHAWQVRRRWRRPAQLAALAAVCVLVAVVFSMWRPASDEESLTAFRRRMVKTAIKTYSMDLETNDPRQIRTFLAQHKAHADYVLPKTLETATNIGCGVLRWQDRTVSMVCFHSGRQLRPGEKTDLFLFVIDRAALPDAPASGPPQFANFNRFSTASWAEGGKFYVLAGIGDEAFLRFYF